MSKKRGYRDVFNFSDEMSLHRPHWQNRTVPNESKSWYTV